MILNDPARSLLSSGSSASAAFGISRVDETHVMDILRNQMYTDKVLAVLREYASNAWDANRVAGRGDKPIEIVLPTYNSPTLTIRDHGPGLSQREVFEVYTQYGASTKRSDNLTVGKLGIGSKSAFSYSDSFTVTSWYGGKKSIYIAVLDESNRGRIDLVYEEALGNVDGNVFETGVEISIAVRREDINEFTYKAQKLFGHFSPRPIINATLPELPAESIALKNGTLVPLGRDEGGEWIAIMGCVPYRVNLDQLDQTRMNKALKNLSGTIVFPIGAVEISASREELKYSGPTKDKILEKFDELIDEYVELTLDLVDGAAITEFEKRLRLLVLHDLDLEDNIPGEWEAYAKMHVKVIDDPISSPITLLHNKSAVGSVTVSKNLRFLIDDTKKNVAGYQLGYDDYVVRANKGRTTVDQIQNALTTALAAANLTGTPIVLLSTLPWTPTRKGRPVTGTPKNQKHKVRFFELTSKRPSYKPYSSHWTAVDRVPEDSDVFVVLEHFEAYAQFYGDYRADCALAEVFGFTMPKIYGYKTTKKAPVDASDLTGTEYRIWHKSLVEGLKTPKNEALVCANDYKRTVFQSIGFAPKKAIRAEITKTLGKRHPIIQLLARHDQAAKKVGKTASDVLDDLGRRAGWDVTGKIGQSDIDAILARYPLLSASNGLRSLWRSDYYSHDKLTWREWVRYVKLIDNDI